MLYFVATSDPLINISRVSARVALGGHDVPHDKVISRYQRTISLLPSAIRAAHKTFVFDNSRTSRDGKSTMEIIAEFTNQTGEPKLAKVSAPSAPWLKTVLANLRG